MNSCFPSLEEGLRLHLCLVEGAPDAPADVCRAYLEPLLYALERIAPDADPAARQTAVHDALVHYCTTPTSYDPQRTNLAAFLRMAARRDLWNLRRQEARHHRDRTSLSAVEEGPQGGNLGGGQEKPLVHLEHQEELERWRAFLDAVRADCTPAEQRVLDLMVAGEKDTAVFAEALGIAGVPAKQQEKEVKQVKDRLKNRLKRGGFRYE